MSFTQDLKYPSKNIIEERNFDYIILWMLSKNKDGCLRKDFLDDHIQINKSTFSNRTANLRSREYIEIIEEFIEDNGTRKKKKIYKITAKGKKRLKEIDQYRGKLKFPPDNILKGRYPEDKILWMLKNNKFCQWKDFINEPVKINKSTLSTILTRLMNQLLIEKALIQGIKYSVYRITPEGKLKYSEMLKKYTLDEQILLNEKIKRVIEITQETNDFINRIEIFDDNNVTTKIRFKKYVIDLEYSGNSKIFINKNNYYLTLLYLSLNHPEEYPNFVSLKEFCREYNIDERDLSYYVGRIVEKNLYATQFFALKLENGQIYYFREKETLERMLKAIVDNYIETKFYILIDKEEINDEEEFEYYSLSKDDFERIAELVCAKHNVIKNANQIKSALIEFLPKYIEYRKFKLKDTEDFYGNVFLIDKNDYELISYATIYTILSSKSFKEEIFNKKHINIVDDIRKLLLNKKYKKAINLLEGNSELFEPFKYLIFECIIQYSLKEFNKSLRISEKLIELDPDNYIGYLLEGINYFSLDKKEESLKSIEKGLSVSPNNIFLLYQQNSILTALMRYKEALQFINDALEKNPENIHLLLAKSLTLRFLKEFKKALTILLELLKRRPMNWELKNYKGILYTDLKKYNDAINTFNEILESKPPSLFKSIIYRNLAVAYRGFKKLKMSLDAIDKAIELEPKGLIVNFIVKVHILEDLNQFNDALEIINDAIELKPNSNVIDFLMSIRERIMKEQKAQ
ncbi:MAG: tetratricopeptide repeat protein [Promethearchaeota archaeon]